jgi:purine catabolism regulator
VTGEVLPLSSAWARVDALHTALTQLVLDGADLTRIAEEVAGVLDLGVAITTSDGRVTASGGVDGGVNDLLAVQGLLDETGRVRVERGSPDGVAVGAGELRVLRIGAGGADLGRLVCVRTDGPILDDDAHALERVTTVAALVITREQAVAAVEDKYRGDFLRDVFLGRAGDAAYVVEHATSYGWDLTRPVMVVCAELDPAPEEEPVSQTQRRAWQERFSRAWRSVSRDLDPAIPSADFSSEVVTLLPASARESSWPVAVVERAVHEVAGDRGGGRRPFSVGVSRVAPTLTELPTAYAQARRAVEIGRRVHGPRSTTYFDQLGIHRLLALVPDAAEIRAFVRDVLGPLADDTEEAADLRATLQVLLDTNFNVAEAARLQFFHYNTMRYRVGKLERLLGPLSRDPHLRLDVSVALRALDVTR